MLLDRKFLSGAAFFAIALYGCGIGKSSDSSNSSKDDAVNPDVQHIVVTKSAEQTIIAGVLSLTESLQLTGDGISSISCVDAVDGAVLDSGVTVGSDGSFSCENIPKCYSDSDCTNANPLQVQIVNEADNSIIGIATAGSSGIVLDVAGCFAAAQAALPDDVKVCLTQVNSVAASNVFQSSLNKAYQLGQIPLDRYTLEQCLALSSEDRLKALDDMTNGSLAEVLIASLDSQLRKELNRCAASAGQGLDLRGLARDFVTLGFVIEMNGKDYKADLADAGSVASTLNEIKKEVLEIKKAVANNKDPRNLVTDGTIHKETLIYQLDVTCSYSSDNGEMGSADPGLNADKTDYGKCASTMNVGHGPEVQEANLLGYALTTKIKFPNVNDPSGVHGGDEGGNSIPFEYKAFKQVAENKDKQFSLNDIYDVFFKNKKGLMFRLIFDSWNQNSNKTYIVDGNGKHYKLTSGSIPTQYSEDKYAPSFQQVFDYITNTDHPFDLNSLLKLKVHSGWNPTGQQYLYVNGKKVDGVETPITCDVVDADGKSVGLKIVDGVKVECVVTADEAKQKRYFLSGGPNPAYLSLISKANGQNVQGADNSPIFLQNINVKPGTGMPKCTAENQLSIYKYVSQNDYDSWIKGNTVKTLCVKFSKLSNPAEYSIPHFVEKTIGTSNFSNYVMAARKADGSVDAVCIDTSSVTIADQNGCLDSSGNFTVCADQDACQCDWQNGEYMRTFSSITQPADGSVALKDCTGSNEYYLNYQWNPGSHNSLSSLKLSIIDGTDGSTFMEANTSYDPAVVGKYLTKAFTECKASKRCWLNGDIQGMKSASDIPARDSWKKTSLVQYYCSANFDDDQISSDCAKLNDSNPVTISMAKFSNAASEAATGVYAVYQDEAYFSNMQIPNQNYNRVFDYATGQYIYSNYDPYCDDLKKDGECTYEVGGKSNDLFFSDIYTFDPTYRLFTAVSGLTGYTHDSNKVLFPADPTGNWDQNTWQTYVNPVFQKIGGPSALACSNDRTIRLSWQELMIGPESTWRTSKADVCKAENSYLVVRNIIANKNSFFVSQPDRMMAFMRMAFGTTDKRAVKPDDKVLDFVQAMATFMLSMDIPPLVVNTDGSYKPFMPKISGVNPANSAAYYNPVNYKGSLIPVVELFLTK